MELTVGKYLIYTKVISTEIDISSNYLLLVSNQIRKKDVNKIKKVDVGDEQKDVKILDVEPYIKTNIYDNSKEYGLVWTVEVLTNPIPITIILYLLSGIVGFFLITLSLDKIESVIETTGTAGSKVLPDINILALIILLFFLTTKGLIK